MSFTAKLAKTGAFVKIALGSIMVFVLRMAFPPSLCGTNTLSGGRAQAPQRIAYGLKGALHRHNTAPGRRRCRACDHSSVIASDVILGRDRELEVVAGLVESATAGGGALLIRGDAGIGKSALVERAVVLARDAGMRVLRTTGARTEANLPFAGLHQLLRPILGGLESLPKPQHAALGVAFGLVEGTARDPFLIALATLTLLADAAARTPILVVADDVQWLDHPSADALAFVARRLGSDPLVMVVGLREGEDSPFDAAGID